MNSISVKLTIANDELYDSFIEPRKINGELPTLVLRLLTAYATNDDLAYQIDQFLDKDVDPEVCEARDAILRAISRINGVDASVSQELESLNTEGTVDETEEFDLVTGDEASVDLPAAWLDDAPQTKSVFTQSDTSTVAQSEASSSKHFDTSTQSESSNNAVLQSIDALAAQVSALTSVVTMLVQGGNIKGIVENSVETVDIAPATTEGVDTHSKPLVNQVESSAGANPEQVKEVADTVVQAQQTEEVAGLQAQQTVSPSDVSGIVVDNEVSSGEDSDASSEVDDELYEIPDFMNDMLAGLG